MHLHIGAHIGIKSAYNGNIVEGIYNATSPHCHIGKLHWHIGLSRKFCTNARTKRTLNKNKNEKNKKNLQWFSVYKNRPTTVHRALCSALSYHSTLKTRDNKYWTQITLAAVSLRFMAALRCYTVQRTYRRCRTVRALRPIDSTVFRF